MASTSVSRSRVDEKEAQVRAVGAEGARREALDLHPFDEACDQQLEASPSLFLHDTPHPSPEIATRSVDFTFHS
jgi:hypothetical protein